MTTDPTAPAPAARAARPYGVAALGAAVLAASVCSALAALLGLWLGGSAAAVGVLVGAGVTLLVLATGFAIVDMVAGLMPGASLLVAVLTYTLQMVLLAGLLVVLSGVDNLDDVLSRQWFAAGVLTVAAAWTVCLVVHAMRARIPLYDLPESGASSGSGSRLEGSER
ncbi:hypothetical protein [Nocardioides sp. GXZ039]|uniref:hypothetical protein n=1 Tax=Nocardioides sp. GXZ039 TaxID=3136018 RepID=UPI0030F47C73